MSDIVRLRILSLGKIVAMELNRSMSTTGPVYRWKQNQINLIGMTSHITHDSPAQETVVLICQFLLCEKYYISQRW